jgi:pyruvate-formate lyase-activating enzyme
VRAAQPHARELLLTDERPHPYLPAFFRAVGAEPGLGPIELLVKTRVDWLLEFADTALAEALAIAEEISSVLHVYLIGFESFDQGHLDLFNKGVTVADNVAAIAKIQELGARFPRSLEYRRHRAHGIILFTPWTSPESLIENARVMRAVGFAELRSQALRTRLRLYPHVPLHALAVADGLVAEGFAEGRPDRAGEQGYDASVPWRFADQRTEAIFHVASALTDADSALPEPDALEAAARFVLRHPGLGTCPESAALPLLAALRMWGASIAQTIAALGPAAAGFDREVDTVASGGKPGCLKEGVPAERAEPLARAYRAMGLCAAIVSRHDVVETTGAHAPARTGGARAIVAIARDDATLAAIVESQRAMEAHHDPAAMRRMGELMGFPSCCTAAFERAPDRGDNLELERAPFRRAPAAPLRPLLNRLGPFALVSHHLCAPDCAASEALAEAALAALATLAPAAPEHVLRRLSRPVLFLDYGARAWLDGRFEGDHFVVERMEALGGGLGAPLDGVRALDLDTRGVRLCYEGGQRRFVAGAYPLLAVPGEPLAAPAKRAITPDPSSDAARAHPRPASQPRGSSVVANGDLPPIPSVITVGVRARDYVIAAVRTLPDAHEIVLRRQRDEIVVCVRAHEPGRAAAMRRGRYALDVTPGIEALPERARAAVGLLARAFPSEAPATPAAPAIRKPAGAPGVICIAPWTTLEVVDPDGRVRQCCADWTAGARGSVLETSLAGVWNGPGYREARRVMASGTVERLCHAVCPRLYDRRFSEETFEIQPGAEPYVRNQRLMAEEIATRREEVRSKPLYLAICPSTYCNYDCIMCLHGRTPRRELPESVWEELPELLPTLRVLTLLGGEPLANPLAMRFLREFDRDRYPDAAVSLVTNGSLLGEPALKHMRKCTFGHVTVSLNAGTPDVYARVQRGLALDDVLANVDALIRFRAESPRPFGITLSFVVQPANAHTLIAFGELARVRKLGIRLLPLSPRGPEGLDYYDDGDVVARVLEHVDGFAKVAPAEWLPEIDATREAIARESASRGAPAGRRLPIARP